jgi:signal transduction histidine kinase
VRIDDVTERRALEAEMLQIPAPVKPEPHPAPEEQPKPAGTSDFVSNLSHEMRNPLNAILGFSEIMQQRRFGPLGNHRYEGYIDDIHMSAAHLLALVNDLLDLGKLSNGQFRIAFESVSLAAIAGECGRMLNLQAAEMGVALEIDVPSSLPPVVADARAMRQLLLNVMSNAVKFTPEGGRVKIAARLTGEGFSISVIDTGIGMTPEQIRVALSAFGQVDSKLARKHEGTGLGLPICRSLLELHGGALTVTSRPNVGTTMTATFPLARVISAAA